MRPSGVTERSSVGRLSSGRVALAVGVVLIAVNCRPAVASVGPVLSDIRRNLGLSATAAAGLTTAPVVCFGALAALAPRMGRRLGIERAVTVTVIAIAAGLFLRVGPDLLTLYSGTVIAAGGIAVANVLLPALIKRDFPRHTGLMMGIYTFMLTGAAALAAGITVPVGRAVSHGWRGALGVWALPAAVAAICWLPALRPPKTVDDAADAGERPIGIGEMMRDRVAWQVTAYFGLQSLSFYAILSWLPSLYQDHGYSATAAGWLLSISAFVQAPVSLATPMLATRSRDQRWLVVVATVVASVALAGLTLAPGFLPYLWVALLGIGQGASFPLALTFVVLRTRTTQQAAELSAMAQTVGYLIAAIGPLVVGALRDASGSWVPPMALLLGLMAPQFVSGMAGACPRFVTAP